MKKFFGEFKKFITRGNVLDMAVGVIVGGAFTGIVNGLSNFILKPIINFLLSLVLGTKGLEGVVTFLSKATKDGQVDLANSIYIDWGSFISAIINFFLIALVLFLIVRTINKVKENNLGIKAKMKKYKLTKEEKAEMVSLGLNKKKKSDIDIYRAKKEEEKLALEEKAKAEAEEKAKQERLANPTTEDLLKEILAVLKQK